MIFVFEFFIFILWDSYEYKPGVLPIPYYDNTLGALVSNLFVVPVVATLIAALRLRTRWILLFAFGLGGIEWLFVHIRVYELHWWRVGYTVATLVFFFSLAKFWMRKLREGCPRYVFVSLWMAAWSLAGTFIYLLAVSGVRTFQPGVFDDVYRDDLFAGAIAGFFKALILAWVVYRYRGVWPKIGGLAVIAAANLLLIRLDILNIHVALWLYWLMYMCCCVLVCCLVWLSLRSMRRMEADGSSSALTDDL